MALKSDDTAGALNVPRYFAAEKVTNFTISYNFNNSKKCTGINKTREMYNYFQKSTARTVKRIDRFCIQIAENGICDYVY